MANLCIVGGIKKISKRQTLQKTSRSNLNSFWYARVCLDPLADDSATLRSPTHWQEKSIDIRGCLGLANYLEPSQTTLEVHGHANILGRLSFA
jgi:hypothetical protein